MISSGPNHQCYLDLEILEKTLKWHLFMAQTLGSIRWLSVRDRDRIDVWFAWAHGASIQVGAIALALIVSSFLDELFFELLISVVLLWLLAWVNPFCRSLTLEDVHCLIGQGRTARLLSRIGSLRRVHSTALVARQRSHHLWWVTVLVCPWPGDVLIIVVS